MNKLNNFFTSYQWQEIVFAIKFVFIIISILLLLIIIVLLIKIIMSSVLYRPLAKSPKPEPVLNKKKIRKRWIKVETRMKSGLEANYKLAVLEADKIFDKVIKELGYGIEKKLDNIDEIKQANKLKDKIIEEKKLKVSKQDAETAVEAYRKGLLGLLG